MLIKNDNVVLRTVHGSIFLIDIADNYSGDKCALYETNETGKFLWSGIEAGATVDSLVKALQAVVVDEVSYDFLFNDVCEYVEDLKSKGFIVEVSANG